MTYVDDDLETYPPDPDPIELKVNAILLRQPIGDLICATFPFRDIIKIAFFDVRRRIQKERDVERYLGIQRPLIPKRVAELENFVNFADATFPTAIIVAIDEDYAEFDAKTSKLTVRNYKAADGANPTINIRRVARVIDGQHRIAGLMAFKPEADHEYFDVPVTVFIGSDIADQAYIFSTVNLEQTKVSRSLAIDLFELARSRSPYKTCHNVAIALDREVDGPLTNRIKRLGFATEGRDFEPVTQANIVEILVRYISTDPKVDRDLILRKRKLEKVYGKEAERLIFRNMFIDGKDIDIATCVSEYFHAVKACWPIDWDFRGKGRMLNRTNGIRALLRAFREIYLHLASPGDVVKRAAYLELFKKTGLQDETFTTEEYPPGTTGESKLLKRLVAELN